MVKSRILLAALLILGFTSCGGKKTDDRTAEATMEAARRELNNNYVDTMMLTRSTFSKQVNCNGRLRAVAKSELTMTGNGILQEIRVHNGSVVRKGDLMAVTDTEEATIALNKAEQELEYARVKLLDALMGQGYREDLSDVPEVVMERTRLSSGVIAAEQQQATASRNLEHCYLYAPFSGRVANMDAKLYQRPDKFCTLIDDSMFDVEFNILEAEMAVAVKGCRVVVSPYIDETRRYVGKVTEVNPLIDDNGQIKIRAQVRNENGDLVEGMNVRVVLESDVADMYVVPKDAVVQRDGYNVVFRYEDSTAVWTYVDVMYSNIDSYAITGCAFKQTEIHDGDVLITSGNLNLADGTRVIPKAKTASKH